MSHFNWLTFFQADLIQLEDNWKLSLAYGYRWLHEWIWIKFKCLPFWAPCCNLATVLTPWKQIWTCQQTIYSILHRNFSLSTVLYNILKSFSHFSVNFFEFKTEIWIWICYLWEKSSKGIITWSKLEQNKIVGGWNNFFNREKTFRWYLLGNRRVKSLLGGIKYTFIFQIVLISTRHKGQHFIQ